MRKVLPLLLLLTGCAGGSSMEATQMAPPESTSEAMPPTGWLSSVLPREDVKQALAATGQEVRHIFGTREEVKEALLLGPRIEVTKLDSDEKTYELVPRPGSFSSSISTEEAKQLLTAKAQEVCAPGSVAILDLDRPDYIRVELIPRGYLQCR